jgi:hypothetical protein
MIFLRQAAVTGRHVSARVLDRGSSFCLAGRLGPRARSVLFFFVARSIHLTDALSSK